MDTSKWKWFYYSELFDINKGKRLTKAEMESGTIPYIGATDNNNGITAFISNNAHLHKPNTISVSYNGSIAEAYYQTLPYWATDDVNVLYPKFQINEYIALFLTTLINKEKYRFNYGRKWDKVSMLKSKIKLPITSDNTPDWKWIEQYVKVQLIPALPTEVKKVWQRQYDIKPMQLVAIKLTDRQWGKFRISSFCNEPYKATAYNAIELTGCTEEDEKSIAYITRTDVNNGCKGYVINDDFDDIEHGNAITIGDTTATIYYQENDFICGDHMVVLRSKYLNKYTGIFITTLLNKERFRYNYGRAFNKKVIANTVLQLPITSIGTPDWQFMEEYIKSLPYSKNI